MATVTPNYSWPVPTSTDLVKDGATAIEALGDAIDATVFALPSPGLTLINTTSFSGVTSVSLPNGTFTATYDSYILFLNYSTSVLVDTTFRTRLAGVDASDSTYRYHANEFTTAFVNQSSAASQSSGYIAAVDTQHNAMMQIYNIALASNTRYESNGIIKDRLGQFSTGTHINATAYDSCTFFRSTGTMTGYISVMGVAK